MSGWDGVGAAYAASYDALCAGTTEAIAEALGAPEERRSLDVGSGTGTLAAALAERGWAVTGCEPEKTMRDVAAARHPMIAFVAGALPELPFADSSFDAVTANFVLNHVPDPRAAAAELRRVARADAALIATIWTLSPSWFWATVSDRAGLPPMAGARLPAEKDFERSAGGFSRMLADGGWHGVEATELSWVWKVSPEALWLSAEGGVASAGALYLSLDPHDRAAFRRAFDVLCDESAVEGEVPLEHTAALAGGRAG
ncbi:class I SAM-dependent methyltransferase [Microbacterium sp.]|uniref:class I SAM-dependent methyltransferase n=1 Tax=Microbacterium sp. TaxID=51671 RepID=UPI002631295B|nr:class I SAM-dependent methyltransferase [Microbacterium sp.]